MHADASIYPVSILYNLIFYITIFVLESYISLYYFRNFLKSILNSEAVIFLGGLHSPVAHQHIQLPKVKAELFKGFSSHLLDQLQPSNQKVDTFLSFKKKRLGTNHLNIVSPNNQ